MHWCGSWDGMIDILWRCWHRSGFSFPWTGLYVLVGCCLVQLSAADCTISMHDQLRDLAYSIVRKEGSSVARRTRLLGTDAETSIKHNVRAQCHELLLCLLFCFVSLFKEAAQCENYVAMIISGMILMMPAENPKYSPSAYRVSLHVWRECP